MVKVLDDVLGGVRPASGGTGSDHDAVTVNDTDTVDLSLTGQDLAADANNAGQPPHDPPGLPAQV